MSFAIGDLPVYIIPGMLAYLLLCSHVVSCRTLSIGMAGVCKRDGGKVDTFIDSGHSLTPKS